MTQKKAIKGRGTVISIWGSDAEYLMPALREMEVEKMKKAYVCEWCGTEVGPEDYAIYKVVKIYYCRDNFECEKELFDVIAKGEERRCWYVADLHSSTSSPPVRRDVPSAGQGYRRAGRA